MPPASALYEQALVMLDRAQSVNPLHGLTYLVRARLFEQNPAFAGTDGEALAAEYFRFALRHDPRLYQGRMEYVTLLLQRGNREDARQT
jgi:hypothetical protein